MAITDWRSGQKDDLEKQNIVNAVAETGNIGDEILKIISALRKELKAALNELAQARTAVVAYNEKFLGELNNMPKSDESKAIRDWAEAGP